MKFGCPARSGKAIPRASFQAFAAVHTPALADGGFPLANADRTGRALRHTVGTPDTALSVVCGEIGQHTDGRTFSYFALDR